MGVGQEGSRVGRSVRGEGGAQIDGLQKSDRMKGKLVFDLLEKRLSLGNKGLEKGLQQREENQSQRKMIKAPAAERNKEPILRALEHVLPKDSPGLEALEVASGTGQHVAHLALSFKNVKWQPTDLEENYLTSVRAFIEHQQLEDNVRPPLKLDVSRPVTEWPPSIAKDNFYDLILNINMMHISPWKCSLGLFASAGQLLKPKTGLLVTYGPYAVNGNLTPESNINFDRSLKERDPEWGIRDIRDLERVASENGLRLEKVVEMPANNKTLVFRREP